MTAAAEAPSAAPVAAGDLPDLLRRMKGAAMKRGIPTADERVGWLEKLEQALISRRDAIAQAISSDFGNRSKHETLSLELFLLLGSIRHARARLREWMEPEDRETHWASL